MDNMDNQEAALPPAIPLRPLIEHYKQDPRMTRAKWVTWACDCAERVLVVFESARPDDMRPRRALEAARAWLASPTRENEKAADAATDSNAEKTWQAIRLMEIYQWD